MDRAIGSVIAELPALIGGAEDVPVLLAWGFDNRVRLDQDIVTVDSLSGLELTARLGAPVELIYVDADHRTPSVLADIRAAERLFPDALIVGDDWQWPSVQAAVEQHVHESGGRLHVHAAADENWWWLENRSAAQAAERPPGGAVAFIPPTDVS